MLYTRMTSPVGSLLLAGSAESLELIGFETGSQRRDPAPEWHEDRAPFARTIEQLEAYFAGKLTEFDLPLMPRGTAFQQSVWQALQEIPYGTTVSYGQIANQIGRPRAVRAVGAANGANPLPIVIPCHRVIGSNGSLTGFGGGLPTKSALLALEKTVRPSAGEQLSLAI